MRGATKLFLPIRVGHQIYSVMTVGPRNTQTKCVPEFLCPTLLKRLVPFLNRRADQIHFLSQPSILC